MKTSEIRCHDDPAVMLDEKKSTLSIKNVAKTFRISIGILFVRLGCKIAGISILE